jgi:hypothetical protein
VVRLSLVSALALRGSRRRAAAVNLQYVYYTALNKQIYIHMHINTHIHTHTHIYIIYIPARALAWPPAASSRLCKKKKSRLGASLGAYARHALEVVLKKRLFSFLFCEKKKRLEAYLQRVKLTGERGGACEKCVASTAAFFFFGIKVRFLDELRYNNLSSCRGSASSGA